MKDFLLYIVAKILYTLIAIVGVPYTFWWYIKNEKEKKRSYWYMKAFAIDVKANVNMGEFFEAFFAKKRGLTSFGKATSISACIGELIVLGNFNEKYEWFNSLLDFIFKERNHCINAYIKEIL